MGKINIKPGVTFEPYAPGGMRILEVLKQIVHTYPFDVTITSGTDGVHSGPDDPHKHGDAFDIRTKDLTDLQKNMLLAGLVKNLGSRFYVFLEAPGTDNEHIHGQTRKGTTYHIEDYFNDMA